MNQYDLAAPLPIQRENFNQQSFDRARPFTSSTNFDHLFQNTPNTPVTDSLSPFRSSVSYIPQNVSHERSSISNGLSYAYQSHQPIYGSPVLSAISQGQPHCTASQPSSPYESRSSSVSAGRLPVRSGTDSPTSNNLSTTRTFSVTSQPMKTISIVEDAFARPSPNSIKSYQQQQEENQWQPQGKHRQYQNQQQILKEQQNSNLQTPDASPTAEHPLRVVGKQGLRGILPSKYDGAMLNPEKLHPVFAKDKNGKYPCMHCQKTYLHAKHLKRHLLRHLGIRPYACYLCRDTFSRSDILKRHFQKCSQRRGNPGGQDHLAEKRRKNRSYSTMEGSWRSTHRSASGSGDVPYDSMARSLSSVENTTASLQPRSSMQSLSTSSSRSSSLLRAGNNSEAGRRMSSVEFIQQQQRQQHMPPRDNISYQSTPVMNDFPFPSASTANSSPALVESIAAYSMPRDHHKSGNSVTPTVYGLNSSVSDANGINHVLDATSCEFVNGSREIHGESQGLQGVAVRNVLTETDLNRNSVSNAIAEHFPEGKEQANNKSRNAYYEQSRQRFQRDQLDQNGVLHDANGTMANNDCSAISPSTSSSYRLSPDTRATSTFAGIGRSSALSGDGAQRTVWPSLSSADCATSIQTMLAPQQHAQPRDQFSYGYEYQPQQVQQPQSQQQQQERQQRQLLQQPNLKSEQHHYYQHPSNPYQLDAQMRPEIVTYSQ